MSTHSIHVRSVVSLLLFSLVSSGCGDTDAEDPDALAAQDAEDTQLEPLLKPGQVEIRVDSLGIAHIYGGSDEDVLYGYGYQIAADRLFQMDMFRRRAHGRMCEVLGEGALIEDQQARIFNWKHWGTLDAEWMQTNEPERWELVKAWVDGVNARIAEVASGSAPRPLGCDADSYDYVPEPWSYEEPFIVQKMAGFGLDQTLEFEIFATFAERFHPEALEAIQLFKPVRAAFGVPPEDMPAGLTTAAAPTDSQPIASLLPPSSFCTQVPDMSGLKTLRKMRATGSNNWAVDGRHTDTGRPMLAGDPHMGFSFSGTLYGVHLNSKLSGGTFDVIGFAFVGAPGIAIGHNDKLAWAPTSAFADVMDMWQVLVDGEGAHVGGEVVPTVQRDEVIRIRPPGATYGEADQQTLPVIDVPGYGVIMPPSQVGSPIPIGEEGKEVLVGWRGFGPRSARYFLELNRAESVDEFDAAVSRMREMTYNFVAADAEAITYRVGVEVPLRGDIAKGREPWTVMDGDDPLALWGEGSLPASQLPAGRGGERGFLATANSDPFGFTEDGVPDNDPWYYGTFFAPGWRAGRIIEELTEMTGRPQKITLAEMQALQLDVHSNLADDLVPVLAEAYAQIDVVPELSAYAQNPDLATLAELITQTWDRQMRRESAGALAFHAFAHTVAHKVLADDIPLLLDIVMETQPVYLLKVAVMALQGVYPGSDQVLQQGGHGEVLAALEDTAELLNTRFGSVDPAGYALRDAKQQSFYGGFGAGIDLGTLPTDGGESTLNVTNGGFYSAGQVAEQWLSDWAPMVRTVNTFDEDGTPVGYANFPLGNVADPASAHFDDMLVDWVEGTYHRLPFSRDEVLADAPAPKLLTRPAL